MSDCSSAFLPAGEVGAQASPSTLKVYVAAIAAYHDAVDGASLGKHQLIVRFLRGARRVNPPRPHLIPSWDLSVTLQGLREAPFEPLASVELKHLSLKTALLTALASIKRVGDLQAFSVDEACLEFGPGDSHIILRPRPGYVPKDPTTPFHDQVVTCKLCPWRRQTRPLRCCVQSAPYVYMWTALGTSDAPSSSLSALEGEPCPLGVHAHSTRRACPPLFPPVNLGSSMPRSQAWVSFAQQRSHVLRPPNSCFSNNWHPCGVPYRPSGRWERYVHIRLLTHPPVSTWSVRNTARERRRYIPCHDPDAALTPGCDSAPQRKPE
ncbi:ATP synthase subunit alpha [Labeo rohita]|uniref:ATP synthase subunit alpha n=1 Tax=Labeo rohita TaxID=84645 RepID=A0ABQ8LQF7_LABRO|nr:ATP synthase subunit alpha [Labeo rohita]